MAITFDELEQLLRQADLKFRSFGDGSGALLQFPSCSIQVTITEEGEGLLVCAHSVLNLSGCPHKDAALEWMADHNYRIKIGRWGCDKSDGEVTIDYFLPVEDGALTALQLRRTIRTIAREARNEVPALTKRAYLGLSEHDDEEDEEGSGMPADFRELLRSLEDSIDLTSPRVTFDPATIPQGAVTETEWMQLTLRALTAGADARATAGNDCSPDRIREWMGHLRDLRERSIGGPESPWVTLGLRDEHRLGPEEETMLLWFASRHAAGDRRVLRSEARKLCGSGGGEGAASSNPPALQSLLERGLVKPTDDDGIEPYCLSQGVVEALGDLLAPPQSDP